MTIIEYFSNLGQEYWMGLEKMYQMTNARAYSLRVMMQNFDGTTKTAFYSNFRLTENVRIKIEMNHTFIFK